MKCEECEQKQKRIEELERLNRHMAESFDQVVNGIEPATNSSLEVIAASHN
jgi:hypothetical protein